MSDLTVSQVAEDMGVSYKTALKRVAQMPGVYSIGHGIIPRYRIPEASLRDYKRGRAVSLRKQTNVVNVQKMSSSNLEGQDAKL